METAVESKVVFDGTHRICPPEETIRRARAIAPQVGITRVANVTGLDVIGIPVVMVARPNSRTLSVSQGKGITLEHATASGLMESIELFHAERPACSITTATARDLSGRQRIVRLSLLTRRQPSRFNPDLPIRWALATDWFTGEPTWVPLEAVQIDFTLPTADDWGCFRSSSNGLASGNNGDEALLHALCELIERDAKTLWMVRGEEEQADTAIDPASVDDDGCKDLIDRCTAAGLLVHLTDMTTDVGVACIQCRIVDADESQFRTLSSWGGSGCHPSRSVALSRAITEAAQSRLTFIAGTREDMPPASYEALRDPDYLQAKRRHFAVAPEGTRAFLDVPDHWSANIGDDLGFVRARLEAIGLTELPVVELTRDDIGVAVVKAIAPGLEAGELAPRYGPRAFGLSLGDVQ